MLPLMPNVWGELGVRFDQEPQPPGLSRRKAVDEVVQFLVVMRGGHVPSVPAR